MTNYRHDDELEALVVDKKLAKDYTVTWSTDNESIPKLFRCNAVTRSQVIQKPLIAILWHGVWHNIECEAECLRRRWNPKVRGFLAIWRISRRKLQSKTREVCQELRYL